MIVGINEDELNFILNLKKSLMSGTENGGEILKPDDLLLLDNIMTKYLLIASASYFESSILDDIRHFLNDSFKQNNKHLVQFFNASILDRGFTSLFDWGRRERGDINAFLRKFFGRDSSEAEQIEKSISEREDLQGSILNFYKVILMRNKIIHNNMHKAEIRYTLEEVVKYYRNSKVFVDNFRYILAGDIDLIPVRENSTRFEDITLKPYKKNEQKGG